MSSKLMWMQVKFGRELRVFVSAYGTDSARNDTEREDFQNYLDDCFGANVSIIQYSGEAVVQWPAFGHANLGSQV